MTVEEIGLLISAIGSAVTVPGLSVLGVWVARTHSLTKEAKEQVTNSHTENFREEVTRNHGETLALIQDTNARVGMVSARVDMLGSRLDTQTGRLKIIEQEVRKTND